MLRQDWLCSASALTIARRGMVVAKKNGVGVNRVNNPTEEERQRARRILEFLNERAERNFRPTDVNLHFVMARFREGYTDDDLRQVVAMKIREWRGTDRAMYLRPETLFNCTKFNGYVGQLK